MSRFGVLLIALGVVACGCAQDAPVASPVLTSVEPAQIDQGQAVTVTIHGAAFLPQVQHRIGTGVTTTDEFHARLGDLALNGVVRQSDTALLAEVPGSLPPGLYALTVEGPNGTATLDGAFTVVGPGGLDGGDGGDSGVDGGSLTFVPSNVDLELLPKPTSSANFKGCTTGFDTGTETWYQPCPAAKFDITHVTLPDGQQATVLSTQNLTIPPDSLFGLYGTRPAIIVAFGDATIDGQLWANSATVVYARNGPGANPASCGTSAGRTGGTRSGGGGGGFGSTGQAGGASTSSGTTGGAGGAASNTSTLQPLRGGCPGGAGDSGGAGGSGGGALQVSALGRLRVNNVVTVSGGGGVGAASLAGGGGGGGSGGMLILEANRLELAPGTIVTSNGGGGGGGAGPGSQNGGSGEDGALDGGFGAPGGIPGGVAGAGGLGAALMDAGTAGQSSTNQGGGGGGGGVGVIFLRAQPGGCMIAPSALFSPAPRKINCP